MDHSNDVLSYAHSVLEKDKQMMDRLTKSASHDGQIHAHENTENEALIVRSLLAENDHLRLRQFWMAGIFFALGTLVGHFVPQLF